jgi:hypothetical protein
MSYRLTLRYHAGKYEYLTHSRRTWEQVAKSIEHFKLKAREILVWKLQPSVKPKLIYKYDRQHWIEWTDNEEILF